MPPVSPNLIITLVALGHFMLGLSAFGFFLLHAFRPVQFDSPYRPPGA